MRILPKVVCLFSSIFIKISKTFFAKFEKSILKFIWDLKGPQIHKTILQKNNFAGLTFPDYKTFTEATAIKTVCYRHKGRHRDQWNRTES